jgi:hypothetical protein
LLNSVGGALENFSRDPVAFMVPTLLYPILMLITLGAFIAVLLIAFLLLTLLGAGGDIIMYGLGALVAVLLIIYSVLAAGYKGAMVSEYNNATEGREVGLSHYLNYAMANCGALFLISLVKMLLIIFIAMPFLMLYYFILSGLWEGWTYILGAVWLMLLFAVEFMFSFSFTAYVVRKVSPITALIIAFNFIKERNVKALITYAFYALVAVTTLLPIINFITYPVFYPIGYTSLILFFKSS